MKMFYMCCIICVFLPFLDGVCGGRPKGAHSILTKELLSDYGPTSPRPVLNYSKQIDVIIDLEIQEVIELNEREQTLKLSTYLTTEWRDEYLTWNTSAYPDVPVLIIPSSKIWRPDIHLFENVDKDFEAVKEVGAQVYSDGYVYWSCPVILFTSCRIDARLFPFDTQRCALRFGSWSYAMDQLNLIPFPKNGSSVGYYYNDNGIWALHDVDVHYFVNEYPGEGSFPEVVYTVILKRCPLFHVLNFIVPCVLLSGLNLLVFILPTESGEKISLGITNLLASVLFQQLIADSLPPSGDMPIISYYFIPMIVIGCLSVVSGVVVVALYHRDESQRVPHWLRKLTRLKQSGTTVQGPVPASKVVNEENKLPASVNPVTSNDLSVLDNKMENGGPELKTHMRNQSVDHSSDWKKVAAVIDNFFLAFGSAITIISIVVTLVLFVNGFVKGVN